MASLRVEPGGAGHEVGDQILVHAKFLVQRKILVHKFVVDGVLGLAHALEDRIGHVLGGDLQLAGDMVLHELPEEGVLLIRQQIIEPDAAAHKHFFHAGNFPELAQEGDVVGVVRPHILAGGGVQALPSAAGTLGQLLFAGGVAEIGGGAAHIVDVALEILVLHHDFRFLQDGFMAAGLDDAALVEGQGAEGAGAEAAPVAHQ